MIIKTFVKGPLDANNYLLIDETTSDAILIDCSEDFVDEIENLSVNLKYILLTHGHYDHVLGIDSFKNKFNPIIYIAQEDLFQIKAAPQMMQIYSGMMPFEIKSSFNFISDGDEIQVGSIKIKAIATPGHTEGGMCYYTENKLFSGDTLFRGTVGRTDLIGGNWREILSSVRDKLFLLPDNVEVLTGHGEKTSILEERKYNEILNI